MIRVLRLTLSVFVDSFKLIFSDREFWDAIRSREGREDIWREMTPEDRLKFRRDTGRLLEKLSDFWIFILNLAFIAIVVRNFDTFSAWWRENVGISDWVVGLCFLPWGIFFFLRWVNALKAFREAKPLIDEYERELRELKHGHG